MADLGNKVGEIRLHEDRGILDKLLLPTKTVTIQIDKDTIVDFMSNGISHHISIHYLTANDFRAIRDFCDGAIAAIERDFPDLPLPKAETVA